MNLLALAAFQQIAGHGGIGRASRASRQPKTTLSRRLRQLEDELGTRLVERGPKAFRLTEEGAALFVRTRDLMLEIEEAGQALAGGLSIPRGRLRVSVPALFGDLHMGRIATGFLARHPLVELELMSDNRVIDPRTEGVDVVVRVDPDAHEDLVGRILFRENTILVSPPRLPRPEPNRAEAPSPIPAIILPTQVGASTWVVADSEGERTFVPRPILRVSSILTAREAVLSGLGVALLPSSVVAADLQSGRLTSWGRLLDREIAVWVLHTSRRLRSPKVTAFVDYLCAAFPNQQAGAG